MHVGELRGGCLTQTALETQCPNWGRDGLNPCDHGQSKKFGGWSVEVGSGKRMETKQRGYGKVENLVSVVLGEASPPFRYNAESDGTEKVVQVLERACADDKYLDLSCSILHGIF